MVYLSLYMATKKEKESNYGADSISVLEGLEPVRKRPGMYIGSTGPDGLHHLVWEIFDNSRDEAMNGHADHIEVTLLPDDYIRVADNGRGIPVGKHSKTGVSALETVMTVLHAGGKFGGEGYKVSGGLHGVGASVVNALSIHTRVEVFQDGGHHIQEYTAGKKRYDVKKVGLSDYRGTVVLFKPDSEIFKETTKFSLSTILHRLEQQAYLVKELRVVVIDARTGYDSEQIALLLENPKKTPTHYIASQGFEAPTTTYYFEGGIRSLVRYQNRGQKALHSTIFTCEKDVDGVFVEVALQYVDDMATRITPFANNIYNNEGGTHITGFKTALTRLINSYAKKNNLIKESDGGFTGDDVLEGLTAVVSVKLAEIQFEGQTKGKLGSTEAQGATASAFGEAFEMFLEEHPDEAKSIINKILLALRARKAAKAAKDSILRKGALEGMTLPGKLADCLSKNAAESELFIVEGDSAGGTAKMGRDRKTQAILPLRGKILNIERARLDKILASEQVKNLVVALGAGIGDVFNIEKLRYHKIILATDADTDGGHIRTLILTLFFRYFKEIIDGGYLYIAQPPLYKINKGKEFWYAFSDEERDRILGVSAQEVEEIIEESEDEEDSELEEKDIKKRSSKFTIQRYKGLGEMNAEQLKETTMDITKRTLKRVGVEDAEEAHRVFDMLMGSEVPPRKNFIQSNAKTARLDI
jgi:DNA gyrase subunit B